MRITELHIENFRSIRELHLTDLGPFVVLYGENGAGKSNIIDALGCAESIGSLPAITTINRDGWIDLSFGDRRDVSAFIGLADLSHDHDEPVIRLQLVFQEAGWTSLLLVVSFDGGNPHVQVAWQIAEGEPAPAPGQKFVSPLSGKLFAVSARRATGSRGLERPTIGASLRAGELAQALVLAQTSPDGQVRRQLRRLRTMLSGPPLHRPQFAPVHYPERGRYEIQEEFGDGASVSLERAGLGVEQVYSVLAQIVISGCSVATIEEPEAHLHAPTTGRDLRDVLAHMVSSGELDQLWVATHSNLFDLDPDGYYDVRLDDPEVGTVVERRPLSDIDARHLYEPGPAKHALQGVLSYVPADTVFFRRPDGTPVTAPELLELLQRDDPLALDFLRAVHGAAVRSVQVQSKFGMTPK